MRDALLGSTTAGTSHRKDAAQAAPFDVNVSHGGGNQDIGVTDGAEQVYLVFWGSQ